jgi:SM-20-related protein
LLCAKNCGAVEADLGLQADDLGCELGGVGVAVRDRFLTPPHVQALCDCARARRGRGEFAAARIGTGRNLRHHEEIRGDSICWVTEPYFPAEFTLFGLLEALRLRLNRDATLGLFDLELHYAWYPPGAGYVRHVDQPQRRGQRRVSLILYLNERWEASDGGELRIFAHDDGHRDIEPVAGRLVAFLTEGREHAVLPTRRGRLSLSGWYRSREPIPLR